MIYSFEDCWVDEGRRELHRAGQKVEIQPKALELLLCLLKHRDRVVSKEELLAALWPDVAVTDASLTRAMNLLRAAVGDDGAEHRVVRTFPRRGYRITAAVEERASREPLSAALRTARQAYDQYDWDSALAGYREAESSVPLDPLDLERLAFALRWAERDAESADGFARAQAAFEQAGDHRGAARMALHLAWHSHTHGEAALAGGWLSRAERALADEGECAELGLLVWMQGRGFQGIGDDDAVLALSERAIGISQRVGDRDVEALALLDRGHALIAKGRVKEGIDHHDEAAAIAMAGGLSLHASGAIYCSVIWGCRNLGDWERASEWTETSTRWCERVRVSTFPGLCRLHRSEVLRQRGELEAAEREVLVAIDDLSIHMSVVAGDGYNELGEIRLRRGDLSGAREAFQRAVEQGAEPEPGLARLRFAEGDLAGGLRGLERAARAKGGEARSRRVSIWTTQVSLALAVGDRELAGQALGALEAEPQIWQSVAHRAAVECARGELALAEGRVTSAMDHFERSHELWNEVHAPWEAAGVQARLAEAILEEGDIGTAQVRLAAARAVFERLGASVEARRCASRENSLAARAAASTRAEDTRRTFVFTDIVGSTRLAELLGDADWEALRRWHHRTLQACFQDHGGEVVGPHEGDGFFIAFHDATAAIECAIAIQDRLASHRSEHGFAPHVRIGAHSAEALRRGGDYTGMGIHVAARVTAAAAAGELLVSADTRSEAPGFRYGASRTVAIAKGSEAVEAWPVHWKEDQS